MSASVPDSFVCADGTRLSVAIRLSRKAQRRRLNLSYQGVLEIVVPERDVAARARAEGGDVAGDDAAAFLESHRPWIERAARRTRPQREAYTESRRAGLPTHLDFPPANELWLVEYRFTQARTVAARPAGLRRLQGTRQVFALTLSGATDDEALVRRALIRFVTKRARTALPPFAWDICREVGAAPVSITVNSCKSAWGVCTRAGDIRIDRRVLFFPADLARQVVLHEAAHLRHLDHSPRFYDELYSYEGSSKEAEKAVRKAISYIPAWFVDETS
jgi:predicted metal-dependent hydrolase